MKAVMKSVTNQKTSSWSYILRPLFLLLILSCWSSSGWTQAQDDTDWYQVEIVIFERLSGSQSGDPETWPKDISLGYPANWRKLLTSDTAADVKSAFVQLPEAERTLNESTGAIADDRAMRVLFHEAWRQPMLPIKEASAIVIRGGNTYEDHTELEGTITLSISRYLHVHTNLWLTQFIPNYGQESEHWPPLPNAPEQQSPRAESPVDSTAGFTDDKSVWELNAKPIDEYANLIEQPFLIKEIVTLEQTRRMRSGELHYIDHPRLGMLIKIDNYNPESGEIEH